MNFFKVAALVIGGLLPVAATVAPARADTYDWTMSSTTVALGGWAFDGSGTLTTGAASGGGFTITGLTGELNGINITGVATGVIIAFTPDNLLFPGSTFLDTNGLGFQLADGSKLIVWSAYAPGSTDINPNGNNYDQFSNQGFGVGVFSLTPVAAVPEPASMALLGAGLFGLGMIRRRRG